MSSVVVEEDDSMPQDEWGEFLNGINFNEKIYKIVAMVNEKGRGIEYLVWWNGKTFEESTWIPIPHLKKFYTEEALSKIKEFKGKEAFKAKLKSASALRGEEKWKFLKNARPNDTKAYNPRIFDDEQMVIDSDDGLGKMPELSHEEYQSLIRVVGDSTWGWGGRRSRKKKRKKKRKTRKKKRKTRKKKRKKRRKTRKKKRR